MSIHTLLLLVVVVLVLRGLKLLEMLLQLP